MDSNKEHSKSNYLDDKNEDIKYSAEKYEDIGHDDSHKRCFNCLTYSTPFWRRSFDRQRILCNACGLYEKTHKRARPLKLNEEGILLLLKNSDLYNKCVLCDSVCFNRPRQGKYFCDVCIQISPKLNVNSFSVINVPSIINKRLGRNGSYHTMKIRTCTRRRNRF